MITKANNEGVQRRRLTPIQAVGALLLILPVYVGLAMWDAAGYRVPEAAFRAACLSNLKEDAQAALLYAEDRDGVGPPAAWMDALKPELERGDATLHCVKAEKADKSAYGYAFSSEFVGRHLSSTSRAEKAPLIFDSVLMRRNSVGGLSTLPSPPRHGGSNCIAYTDGHAAAVRQSAH